MCMQEHVRACGRKRGPGTHTCSQRGSMKCPASLSAQHPRVRPIHTRARQPHTKNARQCLRRWNSDAVLLALLQKHRQYGGVVRVGYLDACSDGVGLSIGAREHGRCPPNASSSAGIRSIRLKGAPKSSVTPLHSAASVTRVHKAA